MSVHSVRKTKDRLAALSERRLCAWDLTFSGDRRLLQALVSRKRYIKIVIMFRQFSQTKVGERQAFKMLLEGGVA